LGGKLKLMHARQRVHGVLQLTRLSTLPTACPNEAEALGSFDAP